MANTRDLLVKINGDTSGLEKALGKAENSSSGLGAAFKKAEGGSFALMGGLTAAGAAATVFGFKSVEAYNASVEASTKLRTNLLNVKGATEEHVAALERQAAQLQSVGVIEDDVIKAGQSQLATFNLQGSTIEKLTPKIADMVAQLKGHNATADTSTSDATSLALDTSVYMEGNGALSFNVVAAQSGNNRATISNSTLTSKDFTTLRGISSALLWVYMPSVTYVTSVTLYWGSSSSAIS